MNHSNDAHRLKRKEGLTINELDDEVLIYDPETARASCLNAFAAEVLKRCDGEHTPAEIAGDLPFDDVDDRLVILALADLQKARLIEPHSAIDTAAIVGSSRRAFLRKLGMGAAVTVPVVAGMAMPAAAQSLSGQPCTTGECGLGLTCAPRQGGGNCDRPGADCICQPA